MRYEPGLAGSQNPQLSALRVLDEPQFIRIVKKAIMNHAGIVQQAAKALKVHRNTLNRWIEKYPELGIEVFKSRKGIQ